MNKQIRITLDDEQYKIFKQVKGSSTDAGKARDIIMAWLHEKSYVKDYSLKREE